VGELSINPVYIERFDVLIELGVSFERARNRWKVGQKTLVFV
jgi:hypothetical protein